MWSKLQNTLPFEKIEEKSNKYFKTINYMHKSEMSVNPKRPQNKNNIVNKLNNYFVVKGFKLKYTKHFSKVEFILNQHITNLFENDDDSNNHNVFLINKIKEYNSKQGNTTLLKLFSNLEYLSLLKESPFYSSPSAFLLYYLVNDLSMIKAVVVKKNKKKTKKSLKNKFSLYKVEYKYISQKKRIKISVNWLGKLIKFSCKPLLNSILNYYENVTDVENSKLLALKNQVYAGLAANQQD